MRIARFAGRSDFDVIELELIAHSGRIVPCRALVDSGFSGPSSMVLAEHLQHVRRSRIRSAAVGGALQGRHRRINVVCRVAGMLQEQSHAAILAKMDSLDVPTDIEGIVGLQFLRSFWRWGGERVGNDWQFVLEAGPP